MALPSLLSANRLLVASALLAALSGCGQSFSASTGDGNGGTTSSPSAGGSGGATSSQSAGGSAGVGGTVTSGSGGAAGECSPGEQRDCYDGAPGSEAHLPCTKGMQTCTEASTWGVCKGQVTPLAQEICDGSVDDDCNGVIDDGCDCTPGSKESCYSGPAGTEGIGQCAGGKRVCDAGTFGPCNGQTLPSSEEECDGIDNNCNGSIDEAIPGAGEACTTGKPGVCATGTVHCNARQMKLICVQAATQTDELCDGLDNDCNGQTDEDFPGNGGACMKALPAGATCNGLRHCDGGVEVCRSQIYFADTFANGDANWTLSGEWEIANAKLSNGQTKGFPDPNLDHSPADLKLAGIKVGGNVNVSELHTDYLTSKPFNTSQITGTLFLSFWRWLNNDVAPFMVARVEVSTGNDSWTTLWDSLGSPGVFDNQWTFQSFDISQYKSVAFQLRFALSVTPGAATVSGWNLDDIAVTSCPPGPDGMP